MFLLVLSQKVFYSHFSLAVLCLGVFMVAGQHGWVGFHQDKDVGRCPLREHDCLLFLGCARAAGTMSSWRGMVGRDQPSSFCLHCFARMFIFIT